MSSATLRDGRRLAYLAVGPRDGLLVLYLHGAIGSPQTICPELERAVAELGVRYLMVARPGFGGSDPLPGRTLARFAGDAAQLADALGHARFAVVGVSAGGPYALACAHELPERIAATTVVGCMAPGGFTDLPAPVRLGLAFLRARPRAATRTGDALLRAARRHPRLVARIMRAGAPPADRRLIAESEAREQAADRFLAAARGGVGGMIGDYVLCTEPWGFDPANIRTRVALWHGMQDALVPVDAALGLAAALPRVDTAIDPDEGHFFYRRRLREILADLVAAAGDARRPAVPTRASSAVPG